MTIWFTADQHFGHTNIIKYSGRPFADVEEMNEELVRRHNAIVRPQDFVWHLGDFAMDKRLVKTFLSRLNGSHRLIAGNHDACHPCHSKWQREVRRYTEAGFGHVFAGKPFYEFDDINHVAISHMPMADFRDPDVRYPDWRPLDKDITAGGFRYLLHGHVHEKWKKRDRMLNIGVDQWNYAPVSMEKAYAELGLKDKTQWTDLYRGLLKPSPFRIPGEKT